MIHTFQYDGFEVEATMFFAREELSVGIAAEWCIDSLTCTVTSLPELIEAYGASQARLMAADLEDWVTDHETANILAHFEASDD